jgi:hypothetical protein
VRPTLRAALAGVGAVTEVVPLDGKWQKPPKGAATLRGDDAREVVAAVAAVGGGAWKADLGERGSKGFHERLNDLAKKIIKAANHRRANLARA